MSMLRMINNELMLESDETYANMSMEANRILYYNKDIICNNLLHDLIMKYL